MQSAATQYFDHDLELLMFNHYHCSNALHLLIIYDDKQNLVSPPPQQTLLFFLYIFPLRLIKYIVGRLS